MSVCAVVLALLRAPDRDGVGRGHCSDMQGSPCVCRIFQPNQPSRTKTRVQGRTTSAVPPCLGAAVTTCHIRPISPQT